MFSVLFDVCCMSEANNLISSFLFFSESRNINGFISYVHAFGLSGPDVEQPQSFTT